MISSGFFYVFNSYILGIIAAIVLVIALKKTWKRLSEIIEKEKDISLDSPTNNIKNN